MAETTAGLVPEVTAVKTGGEVKQRHADGDTVSWLEAMYRRDAGQVFTLCLRLLADARAAEDVTVKVYLRLSHEPTGRWDEARTLDRLRELAVEESLALLRARGLKDEPPGVTPVTSIEGGTTSPLSPATLDSLAAHLPDRLRVVFVLHDGEGLSDRAIAAHLKVDEQEVRRFVRSARTELRRLWLGRA